MSKFISLELASYGVKIQQEGTIRDHSKRGFWGRL